LPVADILPRFRLLRPTPNGAPVMATLVSVALFPAY
jgi:hypothetical protein